MDTHHNTTHHVSHHKMNAIKAIKNGWRHMMVNPWLYIGATLLLMIITLFVSFIPIVSYLVGILLAMATIKFALDSYEKRKVDLNFTLDQFFVFLGMRLLVGAAAIILLLIMCLSTFYPIYNITVTDKEAFNKAFLDGNKKENTDITKSDNTKYDNYGFAIENKEENKNNISTENKSLSQYFNFADNKTSVAIYLSIFLVEICVLIYLMFRVSYYEYVFIDKNMKVIDSIKKSWHITKGNLVQMSILAVLTALIMILGFTALFVGILFTVPLCIFIAVDSYKQMIGESK